MGVNRERSIRVAKPVKVYSVFRRCRRAGLGKEGGDVHFFTYASVLGMRALAILASYSSCNNNNSKAKRAATCTGIVFFSLAEILCAAGVAATMKFRIGLPKKRKVKKERAVLGDQAGVVVAPTSEGTSSQETGCQPPFPTRPSGSHGLQVSSAKFQLGGLKLLGGQKKKERVVSDEAVASSTSITDPVETYTPSEGPASAETESLVGEELMNVRVTIYSLSGIARRTKPMKTKKSKKALSRAASAATSKSNSAAFVPTTAVVSLKHGHSDSGFAMQTFLPSTEFRSRGSKTKGGVDQCTAYWRGDDCAALLNTEEVVEGVSSTFEMTRAMKREGFRSDTKVGQVSLYSHQRIDVNVSIGKGTELIPLGVASIVICGEEEGETVSNVPVKSGTQDELKGQKRTGPKKKKSRKAFKDDPFVYDLGENATLRVGIQVNPKQVHLQETTQKRGGCSTDDPTTILELNDSNLLLDELKMTEDDDDNVGEEEEEEDYGDSRSVSTGEATTSPNFFSVFLCGSLPACFGASMDESRADVAPLTAPTLPFEPKEHTVYGNRTTMTEARILPLDLLSDVSSNTFETEDYTDFEGDQSVNGG